MKKNMIQKNAIIPYLEVKILDEPSIEDREQRVIEDVKQILKAYPTMPRTTGVKDIRNSHYYCCIYFCSKQEKEEFLEKAWGREFGDDFINGYDLAEKLGIEIMSKSVPLPTPRCLKKIKTK